MIIWLFATKVRVTKLPVEAINPPKHLSDQTKGNLHLYIGGVWLRMFNYLISLSVKRIDVPIFPSYS